MVSIAAAQRPVIRGPSFADTMRRLCADLPAPTDISDRKYAHILLHGMIGGENYFAVVGVIGKALEMRGARVTALICDEMLPGCVAKHVDHTESACTRWCHRNSKPFAEAMGLHFRRYSEFISASEIAECDRIAAQTPLEAVADLHFRDAHLGPKVTLSCQRFYKVGTLDLDDPCVVAGYYDHLRAGLYMTIICEHALERLAVDKVLVSDGYGIDWGIIRDVAGARQVAVDILRSDARGNSYHFVSDLSPSRLPPAPRWCHWRQVPLTDGQDRRLDAYLEHREIQPYDTHSFATRRSPIREPAGAARAIGLPQRRDGKLFGIFPNVGFDAALTSSTPAYASPVEWVARTVEFFAARPEHQLIVKAHPGEARRKTPARDRIDHVLRTRFPALPDNVFLLPAESRVTAYAVIGLIDAALVYTSTVALEATLLGKAVLLVGGGRHQGQGLMPKADTPARYFEMLEDMLAAPTLSPICAPETARRYAYMLYFRQAIPLDYFDVTDYDVLRFNIDSLSKLAPGRNAAMDVICRGLLCDEPFEMP